MAKKKPNKATKAGLREDAVLLKWGYRIINHGDQLFSIHEAYFYDKTGKFHSYSEMPLCSGASLKSLKWIYSKMGDAFKHRAVNVKKGKQCHQKTI